ncbi:hypothetical protein DHEL01_v210884 [Diaporthe helianthi]|uniref:Uncharacterized protein n=1 Tax=Diaporthe helianthi TaxID=158607 RepID=A0A2P5HKD9_DIAHE|nr:hypothetical protein DHEL01_v210884 [Diaporthe helianthi]
MHHDAGTHRVGARPQPNPAEPQAQEPSTRATSPITAVANNGASDIGTSGPAPTMPADNDGAEKGQTTVLPASPSTPSTPSSLDSISNPRHSLDHPNPPHHDQDILSSPRHELELIPEDRSLDGIASPSTAASPPHISTNTASSVTNPPSFSHSNRTSGASTPETSTIRPAVRRPVPNHPLPPRPASPLSSSLIEPPLSPVIRSASTHSVLRHPAPDNVVNARSGSYTGNIAALEATAERFSMTSSIEDAIRNAHEELKRSDSRRSSILAATARSGGDFGIDSPPGIAPAPLFARQSSIVGLNTEARLGGYSPAGYIMSPTQSLTGRLRSASKSSGALSRANSTRSKPDTVDGEAFPNLSASLMTRSGPGKGSVRSVHSVQSVQSSRSGPLSLAEIAEMEPPSALTMDAMDEADRTIPNLQDLGDDDDAILARAHQHVEPNATDIEIAEEVDRRVSRDLDRTPMLDHSADSYWDSHEDANFQLRNPQDPPSARVRDEYEPPTEQRSGGSESPDTEDEDNAFADFDGMHCDPDTVAEQFPVQPDEAQYPRPRQRQSQMPRARPQSYLDPETGQQMLYYPARVPAMLNLPPKLGKGVKSTQRNMRRSQVLSQMPQASRESRAWLPDPLEGEGPIDLLGEDTPSSVHPGSQGRGPKDPLVGPVSVDAPEVQPLRRPGKLREAGQRSSRMDLAEIPPQLRATVFFDLPGESPLIEVKDGSAMKTLDSILDAAASAPVNAFTDHAFAGRLGPEVYGLGDKTNRKSRMMLTAEDGGEGQRNGPVASKSTASLAVPEVEKRKSVWSLLAGRSKSKSSTNLVTNRDDDARSRLSGSGRGDRDSSPEADERSALAPDGEAEGSESEEEQVYTGPPTTLLAELQLRKQQHKNRTRNPLGNANGLHSTLLELDAVAQVEARARKNKKVNLAWAADPDEPEESDDEDVPLGLLAARKQIGPNATERDLAVAAQEISRPLGLMEKRDLEDNEPLSRRRDRLQGREVAPSMYLQPGANGTRMTLMQGTHSPRLLQATSPGASGPHSRTASMVSQGQAAEEIEGETLGQRIKRLRAKDEGESALPNARPVSTAFSTELLGELGIGGEEDEDIAQAVDKGKGKEPQIQPAEEEETLGQRRRRLQAEREAREQEMGIRAVSGGSERGAVSSRLDMADVLRANPMEGPQGRMDPREAERLQKEVEAARVAREQSAKMAAFRAQVPHRQRDPSGGVLKAGGYQGGRFNDSSGGHGLVGMLGQPQGHKLRASMSLGQLGQSEQAVMAGGMGGMGGMGGVRMGPQRNATNLVGAAGNYGNPNVGPDGMNPVFSKGNTFGRGYNGGLLQQSHEPTPFVNGSLLASGGYNAFGSGVGQAGGYANNQTAYGVGMGFSGGMHGGYGMQAGTPLNMGLNTQGHSDRVESWRQGIFR